MLKNRTEVNSGVVFFEWVKINLFYRVIFRLFPGSGAPQENLNFDGEL